MRKERVKTNANNKLVEFCELKAKLELAQSSVTQLQLDVARVEQEKKLAVQNKEVEVSGRFADKILTSYREGLKDGQSLTLRTTVGTPDLSRDTPI